MSDADEEVLGASMAHLQGYQSMTQTPFGAMLQKQSLRQQQQGVGMNGQGGALLMKKSSAKEVSAIFGFYEGLYWSDWIFFDEV